MRRISRARPVGRFWCPRCVLWFVCRKWFAIRNQTFFQPARPFVQLILAHCQDSAHCQSAGGLDFICKPFLVRQGCAETQRHLLEKIYIQSVKVWQILEICGYITVMYGHIPKNWWLVDFVGCRVSIRSRGIFTKGSKQQCVGVHPGAELKEVIEDGIVEPFVRWKHFADIQQSCTIECKYRLSVEKSTYLSQGLYIESLFWFWFWQVLVTTLCVWFWLPFHNQLDHLVYWIHDHSLMEVDSWGSRLEHTIRMPFAPRLWQAMWLWWRIFMIFVEKDFATHKCAPKKQV